MAKETGKKSFLDFFKMKELDEDEFDDDLFDEDEDEDEDDYAPVRPSRNKKQAPKKNQSSYQTGYNQPQPVYNQGQYNNYNGRQQRPVAAASTQQNRVVEFSNPRPKVQSMNEVYVMIPHDSSESQTVTDFLKAGKTIVLNMSGLDTITAQRIIDFVAGSTYALDGTLQAISDNIFIAAPSSIEVSGDLRQLLSSSSGAPSLYQY